MDAKGKNAPDAAGERIAKRLARAGIASRRDAEVMIAEGRVKLNGRVVETPAVNVGEGDRLEVDGELVGAPERTRLWLFNKPRGTVTSNKDPEGRQTIFDVMPKELPRVITVGRLDINTEGLLILTNDGGLARVLELPSTGWLRRYRVRVHGEPDPAALAGLAQGIVVDGVVYGPIEATLDRAQGANAWLTLGLREGKNREVKNVLGALGLDVTRLIRVSYGPFSLGDLPEGEVREIRGRVLRDQLGEKLVAQSGADFDAPLAANADAAPVEARPVKIAPVRVPKKVLDNSGKPGAVRGRERGFGKDAPPAADGPRKPHMPRNRSVHVWMDKGARPLGPKGTEEAAERAVRAEKRAAKEQRADERRAASGEVRAERPYGERKPKSFGFKAHGDAPRADGERRERKSFGMKTASGDAAPRKPWRERPEGAPSGERRERKPFDPTKPRKPFDPTKPRKPFDPDRKPRSDRAEGAPPGERRERKPFDPTKPRKPFDPTKPRGGGKPFGGKPSGGKPSGGKPSGGKPGAGRNRDADRRR